MFIHRLEVRFRDCDPMGHANNAVYLTYLEQTRFSHWRSLWGFGTPQLPPGRPGVILARVECDYKRPAKYGDTKSLSASQLERHAPNRPPKRCAETIVAVARVRTTAIQVRRNEGSAIMSSRRG